MSPSALRDHVRQMLETIAKDIETWQSNGQQELKSKGLGAGLGAGETAAESHGALRHTSGFDLGELVAEFRALRATVLRLWVQKKKYGDAATVYEITRFNEAIDQALAESVATYSEELGKSRETFLAILGHGLRGPLSALESSLLILSQPASDVGRAEAMAAGAQSLSSMDAMVQDLLEYTRRRLGKGIPITVAPANLEGVCKAVVAEVSRVYPQTAFRFESGGQLDGSFDGARMYQAISNLLNNAAQHGNRGFPVLIVAGGDNSRLTLQVKSRGLPIAPDLLQVVFDPLVQIPVEESDSRRFTTLGLGMFIAREIVLAHGGTIDARSSAEDGTTFTVELPRAADGPGSEASGGAGPSRPTHALIH